MPDGLKFYDSLKDQQSLPWTLEQSYLSDKYNLYSLNLPPPPRPTRSSRNKLNVNIHTLKNQLWYGHISYVKFCVLIAWEQWYFTLI